MSTAAIPTPALSAGTPVASVTADGGLVLEAPVRDAHGPRSGPQTLTLAAAPEAPATLDPALVRDAGSAFIVRQVFRGLIRFDLSLNPVPDLARLVQVSPDRRVYTFKLFEGLTFHSGRPISAQEFKYSLDRATDPALTAATGEEPPAKTFLADVVGADERLTGRSPQLTGVEVLDPLTLRITLTQTSPDFLAKLASTSTMVVDPVDVARGTSWWQSPSGSGPFKVDEWRAGERLVLRPHAGYLPNPPALTSVTFLLGAAAAQPLTLYERDQVDMTSIPADAIDRVQAPNSQLRSELTVTPLLSGSFVLVNPNIAPFDDPELRRALLLGFDRRKIAEVTLDGHVAVANGIIPSSLGQANWSASIPAYDLPSAKGLFERARARAADQRLTFYTPGSWTPVAMKQVYERDLGATVEVIQLEWPDYIRELTSRSMPVFTLDWVADYPDPENFLQTLFYSKSPENYLGYHNEDVDRLLERAATETDDQARQALYRQAQQMILDDAVVIPLYFDVDYQLIKPRVQGVRSSALGLLGLESVWINR